MLAPLDSTALVPSVANAKAAGIPTVIFDSGLADPAVTVSYVATDNHHGGVLAAREIGKRLKGEGDVILLRYNVGSESTEQRKPGFSRPWPRSFPRSSCSRATSTRAPRRSRLRTKPCNCAISMATSSTASLPSASRTPWACWVALEQEGCPVRAEKYSLQQPSPAGQVSALAAREFRPERGSFALASRRFSNEKRTCGRTYLLQNSPPHREALASITGGDCARYFLIAGVAQWMDFLFPCGIFDCHLLA